MAYLLNLLSFDDLFNHKYVVNNYVIHRFNDLNADMNKELRIDFTTETSIPVNISYNIPDISLNLKGKHGVLSVNIKSGTYKYFFDNYKDYYYLTLEDCAVHKSVAKFVDTKYRRQATASTCYEKRSGSFLHVFAGTDFQYTFKENYKDKESFILTDEITDETILPYLNNIIDFIKQKPKKIN
jgi:hypothetical protein